MAAFPSDRERGHEFGKGRIRRPDALGVSMDAEALALRLAAAGWPVFPLRPRSKKPYADEGIRQATTDPATIRRWFTERPGMNYGVDCSDNCVLDVDVKHGSPGLETLESLGALPDTFQVATPTGGLHVYFTNAYCGNGDLGPGVNVRGINGYVVGPGSTVVQGVTRGTYTVTNDRPVAVVPRHVFERLSPPGALRKGDQTPLGEVDTDSNIARARDWLAAIPGVGEGGRNNAGYRVACALKDLALSPDTIAELMREHWNDRNDPPLGDWEIEKLAHNAWATGKLPPGARNPDAEFDPVPGDVPERIGGEEDAEPEKPLFKWLDAARDPKTIPPRPWVVRDLLLRGQLTGIVAAGGGGKSSLALGVAVAVALGDPCGLGFEIEPDASGPVIFVSTEEDEDEIFRRLYGFAEAHGIDRRRLANKIAIFNGRRFVVAARSPQTRQIAPTKMLAHLRDFARDCGSPLIIFDPLVELHDADENSNNELATVMSSMRAVCREINAAGLVLHHTRKIGSATDQAGNSEIGRGGIAFVGNVRLSFTLLRATEEDGQAFGMSEEVRRHAFRLDRAKGNYVPPGNDTKWYRTTPVKMPAPDGVDPSTWREVTHAVELLDLRQSQDAARLAVFAALVSVVQEADNEELKLSKAADYLLSDPAFAAQPPSQVKSLIERALSTPYVVDGYALQCVTIWPDAREKKGVRGWAVEFEPA